MTEVVVTGVVCTTQLGAVQVWGTVSTSQTPDWQPIAT